jgi:DNA-binding Lrp family transcriptional regulator
MRTGLFIFGLIILIFGLFFLGASINTLKEYETREASEEEQYIQVLRIRRISTGVTVVGLILLIVGITRKKELAPKGKEAKQLTKEVEALGQIEEEAMIRYCPKCGKRAQAGDIFCRSCGTKLSSEGVRTKNIRKIYVLVNTEKGKEEYVRKELSRLDGAKRADTITGPYDNIVVLERESIDELIEIITKKLRKIPGVMQTRTLVVR